ncbi:MAG: M15 family metallopeptidase [Lactobacillus sp.]|jgi:hypothetical protein|nr:M15 family metallopeptidase [Lactobacillus sp.]
MFEIKVGNVDEVIDDDGPVFDSNMSFDEAIKGSSAPKDVIDQMVLVDVRYYGVDSRVHHGQIMANKKIENDIKVIFYKFLEYKFVVEKCVPMSFYSWDEEKAMQDNNTYSFCYGKNKDDKNNLGLALDINPRFNPLIKEDGLLQPKNGDYNVERSGTFAVNSNVVKFIEALGFVWGRGDKDVDDMHHFEKDKQFCKK